jgi:Asp-tRNA(Asn)/Glu-tRNA(Gln) amidotransferase A subunit family amidase
MDNELCRLDASACEQAIAREEITPEELVSACLVRIGEREAEIGAWHFLDHSMIHTQLKRLEKIDRPSRGALHGIPVGVKDIYDTFDMPTGYGSDIYEGHRPAWDAAAVARLRAAGAVVLGKTVSTEFAYWKAGKTRNPHDTERTPGGSSSGSAAAVADLMVPLAIGSQTVASTIRPASYCGIVGFKPSYGRISMAGVKPLAASLDTAGVFARSVWDAGLIASAMAGRSDWLDTTATDTPPAIRLARTPDWDKATNEAVGAVETAASALEKEGASVADCDAAEGFAHLSTVQNTILCFEAAREFSYEWRCHRDQLSEQISGLIEDGLAIAPGDYETAAEVRLRATASVDALFGRAEVLLAPSTTGEAPLAEEGTGDPLMSRAWTLLGLPSLTLPFGKGPADMPLGLQIAARPRRDRNLLSAARWIEARLL